MDARKAQPRSAPPSLPWWKSTWPLGRREWSTAAVAFVTVVAVSTIAGLALTDWFAPNAITRADVAVSERLVELRTPARTDAAHWGALLSDTATKIIATTLLVAVVVSWWRRWHDAVLIAFSLIFEASAFVVTSHLVGRARPDVPRLLDSPVDTSFPSGHVAAATVYLALAVVVWWHTRSRIATTATAAVCVLIVVVVATARVYQGMHFLSDVVGGVALGVTTVAITTWLVGRSTRAPLPTDRGSDAPSPMPGDSPSTDPASLAIS